MSKKTLFQPVVQDPSGKIRKEFTDLHKKSNIAKKTLAAKIFELGMAQIAANEKVTISLSER
jgi:hypothetical protein